MLTMEPESQLTRYRGSLPFQDNSMQQSLFFGREAEADSLFHKILNEDLLVFYSRSGLGKTSLLNAGIFPTLREKGFFPLMCRVYLGTGIEEKGLLQNSIASIYAYVDREVENALKEGRLGEYREGSKTTLWEYFKTAEFRSPEGVLLTPALILDQFEELFTLYRRAEWEAFAEQFGDLIRGSIPKAVRKKIREQDLFSGEEAPYTDGPPKLKVVISMREEHLGDLAELAREIPFIRRSEFRLTPLRREHAESAIVKPAEVFNERLSTPCFSYSRESLKAILDYLCVQMEKEEGREDNEVEPWQLQILCQHIEEKVKHILKSDPDKVVIVDNSILTGEDECGRILQNFFDKSIEEIQPESERTKVLRLFEEGFLSATGRRLSLEQEDIQDRFHVSEDSLKKLQEKRLLRAETRSKGTYWELSHDTLIGSIRESQKRRRDEAEQKRRMFVRSKQKKRLRIAYSTALGVLVLLILSVLFYYFHIKPKNEVTRYLTAGFSLLDNRYFDDAEKNFNLAIEELKYSIFVTKDSDGQAFLAKAEDGLGQIDLARDRYLEASEKFDRAIKIAEARGDSYPPRYYLNLAESYFRSGRWEKLVEICTGVLSDPLLKEKEKGRLQFLLGNALGAQGKYPDSIRAYEIALRSYYEDADIFLNLALSYFSIQQPDKAVYYLKRAEEKSTDDPRYGNNLYFNNKLMELRAKLGS